VHFGLRDRLFIWLLSGIVIGTAACLLIWPQAYRPILASAGFAAVTAWLVAYYTNQRLRRSINRLRRAADAIGQGDFSKRVEVQPGDEITKLCRSFNQMAGKLEATVKQERRLQEQLTRSEKLAVIGELAATVAHEVNNPLDGLQNCSRIIRKRVDADPRVNRLLDLMDSGLYRIEMIVRRLLTFARGGVTRLAPVRLDEVVTEATLFVQPRMDRQNVEFVTEFADPPVIAMADRHQLCQVMINLLLNALDAIAEGGRLTIGVQPDPDDAAYVRLSVTDNGDGIPPEHLPRIFEPFYTTKKQGAGTGLGLAVVTQLVEAHHGTVQVDSRPGQGTTFIVRLPAASEGDRGQTEPLAAEPVPSERVEA
jgi:signal transduction histidine kinase